MLNPYITTYVFQPIVKVGENHIDHVEMLTRLAGMHTAHEYIEKIEQSGDILPYDISTLLRAVCLLNDSEQLPDDATQCNVAVNMSARTLQTDWAVSFIDNVISEVLRHPENLIIEVTETYPVDDILSVASFLRDLKSFGIRISIDDFGEGHHIFEHSFKLAPNFIKINAAYVKNGQLNAPFLKMPMDRLIGKLDDHQTKLIAENVETLELRDRACEEGFHLLQGNFVSMPGFNPYR